MGLDEVSVDDEIKGTAEHFVSDRTAKVNRATKSHHHLVHLILKITARDMVPAAFELL